MRIMKEMLESRWMEMEMEKDSLLRRGEYGVTSSLIFELMN